MKFIVGNRRDFLKRKAKAMTKTLLPFGYDLRYTAALELLSRMYGFTNYNQLVSFRDILLPSELDEYADPEVVASRRQQHVFELSKLGIDGQDANDVIDRVRPTASFDTGRRRPASDQDFWAGFDDIDY